MKKIKVTLVTFIDQKGRILLNRRNDADREFWEFIGGGVNNKENPSEAIKREIHEELNYIIQAGDKLTQIGDFIIKNKKFIANVYVFKAISPGLEKFSNSEEVYVEDLKFYTLGDALKLPLLPMTEKILNNKEYFTSE